MYELSSCSRNVKQLCNKFRTQRWLVIDDLINISNLKELYSQTTQLDLEQQPEDGYISVWPWSLRFCDGISVGKIYGKASETYQRLLKKQHDKIMLSYKRCDSLGNYIYYWYRFLKPCSQDNSDTKNFPSESYFCNALTSFNMNMEEKNCSLCKFIGLLSSTLFKDWISSITDIPLHHSRLSASLTCYDKQSFLSPHNDVSSHPIYLLAFIFYVNLEWYQSWNGELILDFSNQEMVEISPIGNRLVIFKPSSGTNHFIQPIAPIAKCNRYAVSGWFYMCNT